jgi:hypothetical protein
MTMVLWMLDGTVVKIVNSKILVVPVTFGHPWLHHSSHPERTVVPTDVVRVSEPAMCTFRLSVRVFIPLPDEGEKTQNPGSDILNLGSRKFCKFPKTCSSI